MPLKFLLERCLVTSLFMAARPMQTFLVEDEIRKWGAMDKLGSDRARAETSKKVHDIMRTLFIGDWTSEPHFHHQNFAEGMIKELKKFTNC